jgi:acyl-CoA dehydrogenase
MTSFLWILGWLIGLQALAYHQSSKTTITSSILIGYLFTILMADLSWFGHLLLITLVSSLLLPLNLSHYRQRYLTAPLLKWFRRRLPKMSKTENEALLAGTVWWDKEIFTGKPDWNSLLNIPPPQLTAEEQDFLDGPVETVCQMINEWEIVKNQDLPSDLWRYLKDNRFFGIIISKKYGGLEFSAFAHSEILAKIAGCSITVASTVAVPNSLGPAELLHRYGTPEQKEYYLPRLARGEEIPCFALTSPEAGSDATAIPDTGIVCRGIFQDMEVVGIRLNWDKRYITLAPIATIIGLAFKLYDPDHLLGTEEDLGISCALIPRHTPGITIGQRHKPLATPFQNGPTQGKDVFIPLEWIIGGPKMAGAGWRMLVECLSCGRAISLPSSAAGGTKILAATTGAYARIRRQFKKPIGQFEGVAEALARIAGNTYLSESARQTTAAALDRGEAPSVLGAIIKYHLTERYRQVTIDAMDIHGGKGIMLGPRNYVSQHFQNSPISITVEGANILTRCMIIFGQGIMRAHPYIMEEFKAANEPDDKQAIEHFDTAVMKHIGYALRNASRSIFYGLTQIFWSSRYIPELNRASASFAFIADLCLLSFGGKLKFKESISGRLSDMLSMLYLASCALKRFNEQGQLPEDKPLIEWVMHDTLSIFWEQMEALLRNYPNRWIGFLLRRWVMPFGKPIHKPSDQLGRQLATILMTSNEARDRLLKGVYLKPDSNKPTGHVEAAFAKIIAAEEEHASDETRKEAEQLRKEIIAVDYFTPES